MNRATYTFEGELEIRLLDNPCSRCRGYVQDIVQKLSLAELSCDNVHVFEHEPTQFVLTERGASSISEQRSGGAAPVKHLNFETPSPMRLALKSACYIHIAIGQYLKKFNSPVDVIRHVTSV